MSRLRSTSFWESLATVATSKPRAVIAMCVAVALACVAYTALNLGFQPDRNALISQDLEWNQRFVDWLERFPEMTDFVVAVDAGDDIVRARRAVDDLAAAFEVLDTVESVHWGGAVSGGTPRAARLLPMEEFESRLREASEAKVFLESQTLAEAINRIPESFGEAPAAGAESAERRLNELVRLTDAIASVASGEAFGSALFEVFFEQDEREGWSYLESSAGNLVFIRVRPRLVDGELNAAEPAIIDIRHAIEAVLADHDGVEAGLTGIDVMESDETAVAIRDSTMSSIIALVLISALLIAAFRMVRTPLLCAAALLVGISWTFGYLTFAIGHLQILSVVFVAILLGLGIDFGIHLAAAMQHAPRTMPVRTAWAHAFRETGPGMLTGAATTAAAFAITAFTDFRGVAEMGMIASVGILLCLVAMYLVLPALMTLGGKHEKHIGSIHDVEIDVFREGWLTVIATHPRTTLAVTLAITALGVVGASKLRFSADLVALQADHSPSVQWQQRIVERTGTSVWYAVSIADSFDEARERAEAFRGFFSVSRIAGAGALFPEDAALKDIAIAETRLVLAEGLQVHPKMFPEEAMPLADALNGLARNAGRGNSVAPESLSASIEALESSASRAALLVSEACPTCLQEISSGYAKVRSELFAQIGGLLDESPVGPGDLPEDLIGSFLDTSGGETRYAIEIFPELPESVQSPLDPAFLGGFMDDVTSIDPNATGVIAQVYYSSAVIRESFIRAGLLALVVVAVMVFCVFRSVSDAALCLFPVIVGFVLTFGILAATGRSIDLANIIVLPLMFGIGIDAGVHVIHRARAAPTARPVGLTGGTGKAITLTSLTTATGFAAMMLASHRGIAGLGFTLSVGIILTLLACLTILPAMLELRARRLEHQIRSAESC